MSLMAPLFLSGLALVALPLYLHRLRQQDPDSRLFSSAMLLESSERRQLVHQKLRFLILLGCRIALLVLLVAAFAKPIWIKTLLGSSEDSERLNVIVIDRSLSMQHGNNLNTAKQLARSLVSALSPAEAGQILVADQGISVISEPSTDHRILDAAINGVTPASSRLDYGVLMDNLEATLESFTGLSIRLHLISDFQASGFPVRFADLFPARDMDLRLHSIVGRDGSNWAIEFARLTPTGVEISVRGFNIGPATRTLELWVNGEKQAQQAVTMTDAVSQLLHFQAPDLATGSNRVIVRFAGADELRADDQRFLVVEQSPPKRVLFVSSKGSGLESVYFTAAVESGNAPFRVETKSWIELDLRTLERYAFVGLADAGETSEAAARAIGNYVAGGGNLIASVGDTSVLLERLPIVEMPIDQTQTLGPRTQKLGNVDRQHPLLLGTSGWRGLRVQRHVPLIPSESDQVLIFLENGDPFLIERRVGSGRVLLLATAADNQWSNLPVSSVYVGFMRELGNYFLGRNRVDNQRLAGSVIASLHNGEDVQKDTWEVIDPDGDSAVTLGDTQTNRGIRLDKLGFYEVYNQTSTQLVAVNADIRESDIAQASADILTRWRQRQTDDAQGTNTGDVIAVDRSIPIWSWFLVLLALVVLLETIVGNWHLKAGREAHQ